MLENYTKPPLTFDQQLQKLKHCGLLIDNDELALFNLKTIGYYRLSAYWHPFRKIGQNGVISDDFEEWAHFKDVIDLYEFDRQLRLKVMDAIERIEVYTCAFVTETIAHKYGAFGHTEAANFLPDFNHASWLEKLNNEARRSSDKFVIHYKRNYCGFPILPIWMVTELMSLGSLSYGYKGLKNIDKRTISNEFKLRIEPFGSWLHTLSYIRNICSHHGRLWNREIAIRPRRNIGRNSDFAASLSNARIFFILLILRFLLRNVHVSDEWKNQMNDLLEPVAQNEKWREAMGMPEDWMYHPKWK